MTAMTIKSKVNMALVVTPIQQSFDQFHYIPMERSRVLMEMVEEQLWLPGSEHDPDRRASWEAYWVDVPAGGNEANSEHLYSLVHERLRLYSNLRRVDPPPVQPPLKSDWSASGTTLVVTGADGKPSKLGVYYYGDSHWSWCRYRMPLLIEDQKKPWTITRKLDGKDLVANVDIALSVEMV
jgi:hypothetical protein